MTPPRILRLCAAALAIGLVAVVAGAAEPPDAAGATTCRHNLFLKSGIGQVTVRHVKCRRAIRSLRNWVRAGMPRPGPRGWRCRMRTIGDEAPYTKVRCTRGRARMRFAIAP